MRVFARHRADKTLEVWRDRRPAKLTFPTPVKLEAPAVPTDQGSGRHDRQGAFPLEPGAEPQEGQARCIVDPSRPDVALPIEPELFTQEQILSRQRAFSS